MPFSFSFSSLLHYTLYCNKNIPKTVIFLCNVRCRLIENIHTWIFCLWCHELFSRLVWVNTINTSRVEKTGMACRLHWIKFVSIGSKDRGVSIKYLFIQCWLCTHMASLWVTCVCVFLLTSLCVTLRSRDPFKYFVRHVLYVFVFFCFCIDEKNSFKKCEVFFSVCVKTFTLYHRV